MGKLVFRVEADYGKVIRLREEIAKLKQELVSLNVNKSADKVKVLEERLGTATNEFNKLTSEAAQAGAVIEHDFKKKIYDASQAVNRFTEKIITQKAVVKDTEADVRRLGEAYRIALKKHPMSANSKLSEYTYAKRALDENKAALFGLTQEQANARLSVKRLRDEYALFQNDGKQVIETNKNIGLSFSKVLGVIGGVAVLKRLGSEIIRVRGEFQSMQTAIETMVGKDVAGKIIPQIKELAKISPLTMSDMVGAEKMMLGFNIQAEDTIKYLKALSDISMGESSKFNSLTLAFSQMSAAGKLLGQDLNQMISAGYNPLQTISEKTGKSIATLKDEMSKGAISAEMVQQAFIDATSAGGKFYGMSENASKTINGQISMMQDAWDNALNEIGQSSEGVIMSGIQATTLLIQNYETIGKVLVGMIATYGVYKTALITNIALTRGWAIAAQADAVAKGIQTIATKAQTVAQLALNAAMKANPYVLAATLVAGVVSAMWALSDSTSAAERAQERYNKKVADSKEEERTRKEGLEKLVAELQNAYTAELRRLEILAILKGEYPVFFKYMFDEQGHVKDLTEAWKAYNDEVEKNRVAENKKNVKDATRAINERKRFLELSSMKLEDRQEAIKSSPDDKTIWNKYNTKGIYYIKKDIEEKERDLALYQKDVSNDVFNQWQIDLKKRTTEQIKAELEEAKKIQEARKTIKSMIIPVTLGTSPGAFNDEEIGNRVSVLNQELGLRTSAIKTVQNKSYWEGKKKEAQDARDALDVSQKNSETWNKYTRAIEKAQRKIDLYSDSKTTNSNKELEDRKRLSNQILQLELDNKQAEINLITDSNERKRKQIEFDYKKEIALIKKKEAEMVQLNGGKPLDSKQNEQVQNAYSNAKNKRDKNIADLNTEGLQELLAKYQDYDARRREIEEKFIADYKALEKQRTPENSAQISSAQGELAFKKDEVMEQIDAEFASREEEFQTWMDEIASMSLDQLGVVLRQAQNELGNLQIAGKGGTQLAVAKQKVENAQKAINKERSKKKTESPDKRSVKDWKELQDVLSDVQKEFKEIGDTVGGVAGEIISAAGEITGSSLNMINGILTLANWSSQAITTTSQTASKSIQSVEKASVILAIISAALQIAMKIASLFAGKSKAQEDTEKMNKVTDKLAETNGVINKLIDKRIRLIEKATAAERGYLAELTKEAIKVQEKYNEQQFDSVEGNWILAKKGKNNNLTLKDLGIDSIEKLKEFMEGGALEYLNNGYGFRDKDAFEAIVKTYDDLIEKKKELQETQDEINTGINFDDVKDSLDDLLLSADATMRDISDSFEDYMKDAILNVVKNQYLTDALQGWYKEFSDKLADDDLSENDANALRKKYEDIVEEAQKRVDNALAVAGISLNSTEQSATLGGFETMSQDTGSELNGRFTALQAAGEVIKNQAVQQTGLLASINNKMSLLNIASDDIPTLPPTTSSNIADRTRKSLANSFQSQMNVVFPTDDIKILADKMSNMERIVDEMRTFQVNANLDRQSIAEHTAILAKNSPEILATAGVIKQNTDKL